MSHIKKNLAQSPTSDKDFKHNFHEHQYTNYILRVLRSSS